MERRFFSLLQKELPTLIAENVIDRETAGRIENYYQSDKGLSKPQTILTIIGSLAALLIGGGIILIFAYNWHKISTLVKTSIAFLPLIGGQVLLFYTKIKKKSLTWEEFSGIFLSLAVGAVIALISQIYQLPGDMGNFLFVWMILILPLYHLTKSLGVKLIYLSGILFWCAYSQTMGGHALWYWFFFLAVLPDQYLLMKKEKYENRTAVINWFLIINILIGTGISLEKTLPGLWILIYSMLLTFIFLLGIEQKLRNPFRIVGPTGIVLLSYLFTYEFFWEEIGWDNYRSSMDYIQSAAALDYIVLGILLALVSYFLYKLMKNKELKSYYPFMALFPLTFVSYLIGSLGDVIIPQTIFFNLFTLCLGGWFISLGIREEKIYKVNLGMLTVILIIVTRFFDMDIGFTEKGLAFILMGIAFLLVNRYLGRKMNHE